jgi:hypothetical protein
MSDMPSITYFKKIGNRYYLQRRVPKDLESEYPPRSIKRALGTSDYSKAKEWLQVELLNLEQEFADKRRKLIAPPVDEIGDFEVERLAAIWLADKMDLDKDARMDRIDFGDASRALSEIYDDVIESLQDFPNLSVREAVMIGLIDVE